MGLKSVHDVINLLIWYEKMWQIDIFKFAFKGERLDKFLGPWIPSDYLMSSVRHECLSLALQVQMTIMYAASPHKLNNLEQAKLFLTRVNTCVGVSMYTPCLPPSYDHVAFRMMPLWSLSLHRRVIGLNCLSDQGCPHVVDINRLQYELENQLFFLCVCQKKNLFNDMMILLMTFMNVPCTALPGVPV